MNQIYEQDGLFDKNIPLTDEAVRDLMDYPLSPVDFRNMSDVVLSTIGAKVNDRIMLKRLFADVAAIAIQVEQDNEEDETAIEKMKLPSRVIGSVGSGKSLKSTFALVPEFVHFIIEMVDDFTQNVLKPAKSEFTLSTNALYYTGMFADTMEALLFYYPVAYTDMEHLGFARFHQQIVLRQPLAD